MIERFEVTASFYEIEGHRLRKHLDIRGKDAEATKPDLMVIMMNPGSSAPKGSENLLTGVPVEAKPDTTQYQIMRIIQELGWHFARVLNLSDLRNQNSSEFYKLIRPRSGGKGSPDFAHSILDDRRTDDFESLFIPGVPVICAWGVDPVLQRLSCLAMKRIASERIVGWKKPGLSWPAYYHPLPRSAGMQAQWRERILMQLGPSSEENTRGQQRL